MATCFWKETSIRFTVRDFCERLLIVCVLLSLNCILIKIPDHCRSVYFLYVDEKLLTLLISVSL